MRIQKPTKIHLSKVSSYLVCFNCKTCRHELTVQIILKNGERMPKNSIQLNFVYKTTINVTERLYKTWLFAREIQLVCIYLVYSVIFPKILISIRRVPAVFHGWMNTSDYFQQSHTNRNSCLSLHTLSSFIF